MAYTTHTVSTAGFIADVASITRNSGRQIDWANVNASFADPVTGKKHLPAGTVVGELLSGNGKVSPRVVTTNPATGILETDAVEGNTTAAASGYGVIIGGVIYEALLPDASGSPRVLAAAVKTELQTAGQTTGFAWMAYSDSR